MDLPASAEDLAFLPATRQRALMMDRQISARELLLACMGQVNAWNEHVNAIVTIDPAGAMRQAQILDDSLARGQQVGPLHGLVVAHKDLMDTAGMRTTHGSLLYQDNVPEEDAEIAARMRRAGAIRLGKTNVPEMGAGSHTFNPVFGASHNPYGLDRTVGGSSGGAGAALATGMVSLADGSDLGGSLRNPASFNNVVGFRSSIGQVSRAPVTIGWIGLSVGGAMGRTVADTALLHSVIAGYDPRDPLTLPVSQEEISTIVSMSPPSLKGLRVGWSRHPGGIPVEPVVTSVLDETGLTTLRDGGAVVTELEPSFEGAEFSFRTIRAWGMAQAQGDIYRQDPSLLSENVRNNVEWGLDLTATDIHRAYSERTKLYLDMVDLFERIDVLALPTVQLPPFPVEWTWPREVAGETQPDYLGWMRSCWYVSATGLPAISVPCGFTPDGLPIGLQLVGRPHGDTELLRIALGFEAALPAWQRRPVASSQHQESEIG